MSRELAGRLAERVTVERQSHGRDALGCATGAWLPVGAGWAGIAPLASGAPIAGEAASAAARFRVTVRRALSPAIGDRIVWGARRLRVRAIEEDPGTRDRVALMTEEER